MTLSLLIAALHTGHTCLEGLVSNHWCKHGQLHYYHLYYSYHRQYFTLRDIIHFMLYYQIDTYQKRWPHILTTASFAVSKQILHSNILSSFSFSSVKPADPDDLDEPACSFVLVILKVSIHLKFYRYSYVLK